MWRRLPKLEVLERTLLNRLKVNYRHVPMPYCALNSGLWYIKTFKDSKGKACLFKVWRRFRLWKEKNKMQRQPLVGKSLDYIKNCGATLWKA